MNEWEGRHQVTFCFLTQENAILSIEEKDESKDRRKGSPSHTCHEARNALMADIRTQKETKSSSNPHVG